MKLKVTFEFNGKRKKVVIEGNDYSHIMRKARSRCHYRRHIYGEDMKVVKKNGT